MSENIILWRREFVIAREIAQTKSWILLYGRRKTGKSYTVKTLLRPDLYITITRNLQALTQKPGETPRIQDLDKTLQTTTRTLSKNGFVVIDEFQRLPDKYWDLLVVPHPQGRLWLLASSYSIIHKVIEAKSPLLGIVYPIPYNIINYADTILSLAPRLPIEDAILWATLLRDPWITGMPGLVKAIKNNEKPWKYLARHASLLASTARSLIGEIFTEEERQLTKTYDAILQETATPHISPHEIAIKLHARGLLEKPSPGTITGILERLTRMGLINKTKLWRTRRARILYRHQSPLLAILYTLINKYAIDEIPTQPPHTLLENTIRETLAIQTQFSIGELLAEYHQGIQAYTILPHGKGDIDIVILDPKAKHPLIAYEVKTGKCTKQDQTKLSRIAHDYGIPQAKLVCIKPPPASHPDIISPQQLFHIAQHTIKTKLPSLKP